MISRDIAGLRRYLLRYIDAHPNLELHIPHRQNSVYVIEALEVIEEKMRAFENQVVPPHLRPAQPLDDVKVVDFSKWKATNHSKKKGA
ncbi:MAG: hypothetical protein GC185_01745 [Alphaproteobacteria bacterium]|nr:hypothetical protein [Alphaproteobacteria bacterium]